jgi:hypothetical protein
MITMIRCCEYTVPRWGKYNLLTMTEREVKLISAVEPYENLDLVTQTATEGGDAKEQKRELTTFRSVSEGGGEEWTSLKELEGVLSEVQRRVERNSAQVTTLEAPGPPPPRDGDLEEGPVKVTETSLQESLLAPADGTRGDRDREAEGVGLEVQTERFLSLWRNELVVRVLSGRNHDYGNALINRFYTQEMKDLAGAEHVLHAHLAHDGRRRVYPHLNHMKMFSQTQEILLAVQEVHEVLTVEGEV